jgi:hypothetical protein
MKDLLGETLAPGILEQLPICQQQSVHATIADTIAPEGGLLEYLTPAMKNRSSFVIGLFVCVVFHLTTSTRLTPLN